MTLHDHLLKAKSTKEKADHLMHKYHQEISPTEVNHTQVMAMYL